MITTSVHGATDLGRLFFFAEFATAVAGHVLGINPFDQPNVQEAKDNTAKVLAQYAEHGSLPEVADADDDALRALLRRRRAAAPTSRSWATSSPRRASTRPWAGCARRSARARAARRRSATGRASCTPRASCTRAARPTGRFLQLVHDGDEDVEVPDAGYTFATLKNAQAVGDLQHAARPRPAGRARAPGGRPGRGACAHLADKIARTMGGKLMQLGFVGLGRMGGNMVAPHPPRLRPRGRGLRLQRRTPCRRPRATAPPAPRRSRTWSPSSRRRARCGSWSRPATRPQRRSTSWPALMDAGDTIIDGGNSRWSDDKARAEQLAPQGHPLRRRRHLAAACGACRSATA